MIGDKNGEHWITPSRAHSGPTGTPSCPNPRTRTTGSGAQPTTRASKTEIRAGEIIAYKCWLLNTAGPHKGSLLSMSIPYLWAQNKNYYEAGVPNFPAWLRQIDCQYWGDTIEKKGFYTFKELQRCKGEYNINEPWWAPDISAPELIVYGTVAMWGRVHEYDFGYRAQYVAINSIIEIVGFSRLWNPVNYMRWCSSRAKKQLEKKYIPASFNGRTAVSETANWGSTP